MDPQAKQLLAVIFQMAVDRTSLIAYQPTYYENWLLAHYATLIVVAETKCLRPSAAYFLIALLQ